MTEGFRVIALKSNCTVLLILFGGHFEIYVCVCLKKS